MNDEASVDRALLIALRDVGKTFVSGDAAIKILEHVDLDIHRGESIAVTGKSGSGKSTLLHIIGALDRPTEGSVLFQGMNMADSTDKQLSRFRNLNIGFIFQSHLLLDDFNALENVCMPALIDGKPKSHVLGRAKELLERVGLAERLGHSPLKLSGGERQRVAICRALMNDPPIIIDDEPTGSLDEESGAQVADMLFTMVQQEHKALLLVSHDRQTAARCASLYVLHNRNLERVR